MSKRIAVIPGDGIGPEVMPEAIRVLEAVAAGALDMEHFDFACWPYYERHGQMMPSDWRDQLAG